MLVYSQNESVDDEVDPSLAAFRVLIGSVRRPDPDPPKVKTEPPSDNDKKEREGNRDHRPVATKNHMLSHNRRGDPIDKVVSIQFSSSFLRLDFLQVLRIVINFDNKKFERGLCAPLKG